MNDTKQRLDKWLWYARIVKSRTLAQKVISSGVVRVDGARVTKSDYKVTQDCVLTLSLHDRVRIFKILNTGTRRGPAPEAATLYEDMSPALPPRDPNRAHSPGKILREPGTGRPTKRERRLTNKLIGKDEPEGSP